VGDAFVAPSAEGAAAAYLGSAPREGRDPAISMAVDVNRESTDPTTYPLILASYIIGCQKYADSANVALIARAGLANAGPSLSLQPRVSRC
jgi:phosphate transport system substrate-binding protein